MATYIVGDIQGCYDGLKRLLAKVDFTPGKDTLVAVGDLIARGPDSLKTLKYLYSLGDSFVGVLGNHDLHFLAITQNLARAKRSDLLDPLLADKKLERYIDWLRQLPLGVKLNKRQFVSHAGLYPAWSIKKAERLSSEVSDVLQSKRWQDLLANMYGSEPRHWNKSLQGYSRYRFIINAFTRMRYLSTDMGLEFATKTAPNAHHPELLPWFEINNPKLDKDQCIFFGHWASLMGKTDNKQFIGLDTGYVWGNHMTLYHLEKDAKISVENLK